jgi:glutathione synthase/RimK-type ligase-like ATP-grasp enzyme
MDAANYQWTPAERAEGLALAQKAAKSLECGFVAIDIAMTVDGAWTIIECNDAMESGYAAVSPFALWKNILDCEAVL